MRAFFETGSIFRNIELIRFSIYRRSIYCNRLSQGNDRLSESAIDPLGAFLLMLRPIGLALRGRRLPLFKGESRSSPPREGETRA